MAQFVQLQNEKEAFSEAGIGLVGLTYDTPEQQQAFVDKNAITYPFLSDIDAYTVKALDILNAEYAPGDGAYGIPHPGIFVVRSDGTIAGKVFVDGYQKRVTATAVLEYAKAVLSEG
ncbi:MAG: peroxiredoxin family protein [Halioglobus sp.]